MGFPLLAVARLHLFSTSGPGLPCAYEQWGCMCAGDFSLGRGRGMGAQCTGDGGADGDFATPAAPLKPERSPLSIMSAPPSHAKPPGDDFVLWPETPGHGAGRTEGAHLQRVLDGLAPAEQTPEGEGASAAAAVEAGSEAQGDQRFYPASRQWFRTTAAIPASDATDKWWQEPASAGAPGAPAEPVIQDSSSAGGAHVPGVPATPGLPAAEAAEYLSPETIWELAAEELEQASRLRARPASAVRPEPALPQPLEAAAGAAAAPAAAGAIPGGGMAGLAMEALEVAASAAEAQAETVPRLPEILLPAVEGERPAVPVAESGRSAEVETIAVADELKEKAVDGPVLADVAALSRQISALGGEEPPPSRVKSADLTLLPAPGGPTPFAGLTAEVLPAQSPESGDAESGIDIWPATGDRDAASSPLIPFPRPAEPAPAATAMVEPLPAIPLPAVPASPRPVVFRRAGPASASLPTQRRPPLAGRIPEPETGDSAADEHGGSIRTDVEHAEAGTSPESDDLPISPDGRQRGRRRRSDRSRGARSERRRRPWGRWMAGMTGVMLVVAGVAVMMGRDHLPTDWSESAGRWWQKAHQWVFPHQYGHPRRGVQPRSGQDVSASVSSPVEAAPSEQDSADPGPEEQEVAEPASAPPSPTASDGLSTPLSAGDTASSPQDAGPATGAIPLEMLDGFPVLRAEPVDESGLEAEAGSPSTPPDPSSNQPGEPEPPEGQGTPADSGNAASPEPSASPAGSVLQETSANASGLDAGSPAPAPELPADASAAETPGTREPSISLWDGEERPPAGTPIAESATPPEPPAPETPGTSDAEVREARRAVRGLVEARTVADVLPWIFDARKLESSVRDYHARNPLQPMADAVIEHEFSDVISSTGAKVHIFNVLGQNHPRGFPVSAESTPQGYRIDWQSYIQWRDGWLRRFLETKPAEPQTLFVFLSRTHHFNDDVPNLDHKHAFRVTSAVPDDEGAVAFVDKNSAVGRSLAEVYEWRTMYFPVVELQWVPAGKDGGRYIRLNRIVRPTWRRVGQ